MIDASNPTISREAAKAILELDYRQSDQQRMTELARKSNEELLSDDERRELESYVFVCDVRSLLHSEARLSLSRHCA